MEITIATNTIATSMVVLDIVESSRAGILACCEATTKENRDAVLQIVKKAEKICGLAPFGIAKDVMAALWQRHLNIQWLIDASLFQVGLMF